MSRKYSVKHNLADTILTIYLKTAENFCGLVHETDCSSIIP